MQMLEYCTDMTVFQHDVRFYGAQVEKARRKEAAREALLAEDLSRSMTVADQRRRLQQV